MANYLNSTGVTLLWNKFKSLLSEKANKTDLSNVIAVDVITPTNYPEIDSIVIDNQLDAQSSNPISNRAVSQSIDEVKEALFIDMWNTRGDYNPNRSKEYDFLIVAKYDPVNAPDPQHPYYINKLWLTYEEALRVYNCPDSGSSSANEYTNEISSYAYAKTLFPKKGGTVQSLKQYACMNQNAETLRIMNYYIINNCDNPETKACGIIDTRDFAVLCNNLKEVIGILELAKDSMNTHFYNTAKWPYLETIWLKGIKYSFSLRYCESIKVECWQYMIDNAANSSAIEIIVHTNVYANLTNSSNAVWHKVFTDAAARNITFVDAATVPTTLEEVGEFSEFDEFGNYINTI